MSGSACATLSATSSATATSTSTTTATPSSAALPAVGAAIGGMFAGAAVYQFSLAFLIPWVVSALPSLLSYLSRGGGGKGGGPAPADLEKDDRRTPLLSDQDELHGSALPPARGSSLNEGEADEAALAATAAVEAGAPLLPAASILTVADAPPSPSTISLAQTQEIARLSACVAAAREQLSTLRASLAADGRGFAEAAEEMDPTTAALNALWDRGQFLRACTDSNATLVALCDDALADVLPSGPALAAALGSFFTAAGAAAAAAQASAAEGAAEGEEGFRAALALLLADAAQLTTLAQAHTQAWLQQAALPSLHTPSTLAALGKLSLLSLQCALWSEATDANLAWQLGMQEGGVQPLANALHQQFSLTGSTLQEGATVAAIGPTLVPRQPRDAALPPATPEQMVELRGRRCLTVVVAAE